MVHRNVGATEGQTDVQVQLEVLGIGDWSRDELHNLEFFASVHLRMQKFSEQLMNRNQEIVAIQHDNCCKEQDFDWNPERDFVQH